MKFPFKLKIPAGVRKIAGAVMRRTKAASPEICLVGGIICGGAALVLVGVETWKGKEKLASDIREVKLYATKDLDELNVEDAAKLVDLSDDTRKKMAKRSAMVLTRDILGMYWKPAGLAVGSAVLVCGGHMMLRNRLSAAMAATAAIKKQYDNLCKRVRDYVGEEKAQEIIYGTKTVECVDEETGQIKKKTIVDRAENYSPYAFTFDEGDWDDTEKRFLWRNPAWNRNKLVNQNTIASAQVSFNNLLKARGYVYENEVRLAFGMPPKKNGWHVGWVLGGNCDGFIDFGVLPGPYQIPINKRFMDERDSFNTPIIDLNVDGSIDYIFDDIYEYDNTSNISFNKRRNLLGGLGV